MTFGFGCEWSAADSETIISVAVPVDKVADRTVAIGTFTDNWQTRYGAHDKPYLAKIPMRCSLVVIEKLADSFFLPNYLSLVNSAE